MADYAFDFTGGKLCLNFANTVSNRATSEPIEHLRRYEDWLAWSRQAGTESPADVKNLERLARRHPHRAQATLERALSLRESLYAIFSAIAEQKTPPPQALAALNRALPAAMARPEIVGGGFRLCIAVAFGRGCSGCSAWADRAFSCGAAVFHCGTG